MDFQLNDEQKRIVALIDELGKKEFAPRAAHWDENHEYPWENVHKLRECDILGMTIPTEYGGQVLRCYGPCYCRDQYGSSGLCNGLWYR